MTQKDDSLRLYISAIADGEQMPTQSQWDRICALAASAPHVDRASLLPRTRILKGPELAEQLKSELAKPGRSQVDLAGRLGVHQSAVSRMTNGSRRISISEAAVIDQYLTDTAT